MPGHASSTPEWGQKVKTGFFLLKIKIKENDRYQPQGGGGWGGTQTFSYIHRLESFFFFGGGGSKFWISIFLGVFRKNNIFGGYEDFCGYFLGSSQNLTILRGHFYFWGVLEMILIFFGGCWARAYVWGSPVCCFCVDSLRPVKTFRSWWD